MLAVFLDRDGVVNEARGFVAKPEDVRLIENAAQGIELLNSLGLKVIVVTNQPQVARGLCTEEDVNQINRKIQADLEKQGAHIDAFYYCPHHPETHHKDVPDHARKYRVVCKCRKPETGMIEQAANDYDIDVKNSFVVGDRTVDIQAGKNAGCKTILVKTGEAGKDKKHDVVPNFMAQDLLQAAKIVRNNSIQTLILAGGKGERLHQLTKDTPKPLITIAGKPVLQHQIELLRSHGIDDIVICASYLGHKIKDYFGDGSRFGVTINYPEEPEQLGSGGAVRNARQFIRSERFMIMNGDKMIGPNFDFTQFIDYDKETGGFATILVRETDHPLDSDIVEMDSFGKVVRHIGKGQTEKITSNSGMIIAPRELLDFIPEGVSNIEKDVIFNLISTKSIYAFVMPKDWFVKDMGTPERLESIRKRFELESYSEPNK